MRILYVDVDALRADHLGCYGYARSTSPTIDRLAAEGLRLDQCYISDAPCLPSRTAMTQGRFGIHTGVTNHGGEAAHLRALGPARSFNRRPGFESWFTCLQEAGLYTASISPFPQRHGGWWFLAGLREWINPGRNGNEDAHEINAHAVEWLDQHAASDDWFLHVNYWDPHTPYTAPSSFGNPFEEAPPPDWYSAALHERHWNGYGTFSAQDPMPYWYPSDGEAQRKGVPTTIDSVDAWKRWVDGYDTGIRYMDEHLGDLVDALEHAGVLDETLIIVTADHGENQGELNIYGDHQTADQPTCRVPLVMRYPEWFEGGRVHSGLQYQFDVAATVLDCMGEDVPSGWDAESMTPALQAGEVPGRPHLVLSQMAWSCQRSVRFEDWLFVRTYHPGLKDLPPRMLFNVERDPHQLDDSAADAPATADRGQALLEAWHAEMMRTAQTPDRRDPLQVVMDEGGPFHTRGRYAGYLERLHATGRAQQAERLAARESSLRPEAG